MIYKMVELKEGAPVQYLGAYVLRWKSNGCAEPQVGFVEATKKDIKEALKNEDYLE